MMIWAITSILNLKLSQKRRTPTSVKAVKPRMVSLGPEHVGEHPSWYLHEAVDDVEGGDEEAHCALVYPQLLD
jgi:hypothetical protein